MYQKILMKKFVTQFTNPPPKSNSNKYFFNSFSSAYKKIYFMIADMRAEKNLLHYFSLFFSRSQINVTVFNKRFFVAVH